MITVVRPKRTISAAAERHQLLDQREAALIGYQAPAAHVHTPLVVPVPM